ncbi:hypothetical protein ACFYTG_56185 [Streptomyces mirabilis]|uniref:hypothetical protein n=1 Tax=Streptomyces mirabilis TaxID=68239 RepID=UPI0036AA04AA
MLPVSVLSRRADVVEVIGAGLQMKAGGAGHRAIADLLGRPATTVRGWLRRFAARAAVLAGFFTTQLVALAADPVLALPAPAASVFADAVAAVIAVSMAVRARFPMVAAPIWQVASAVSRGSLMAPRWPPPVR